MARIEWVRQRLENWALWHERKGGGALGYASQSSFLSEAAETSRYRESTVPVDEVEASVTDTAVESMMPDRAHLYRTLHLMYIAGVGIKETARAMARAESTVHAHLGQADAYLAQWFSERKRRQAEQLAARQRAEATARALA